MAKRQSVCKKLYILPDDHELGASVKSAHPDAIGLEFHFSDTGKTVETIMKGQFPNDIESRLDWFGRSEKFGNFYAGVKGDAELAVQEFVTGVELLESGEWKEGKEGGGPRPSMVAQAIVNVMRAQGIEVDDERESAIREKVKDKDVREGVLKAEALVKAEYEQLRLAAMQDRANKAQDAAKDAAFGLSGFGDVTDVLDEIKEIVDDDGTT